MNPLEQMNSSLITIKGKQYTNNHNIPHEVAIFNVFNSDSYDGKPISDGYCSVTNLLSPVQQNYLRIKHPIEDDTNILDVSSFSKSARGTAMHSIMEQALEWADMGYTQEVRSEVTLADWTISGKFDIVTPDGKISDLKHVAPYALKKLREEQAAMEPGLTIDQMFEQYPSYFKFQFQLSMYSMMNPDLVTKPYGSIIFMLNGSSFDDLPQESEVTFPLLPKQVITDFATKRVQLIKDALAANEAPLCTDAERWYKEPEYKLTRRNSAGKMATVRGSKFTDKGKFNQFCNEKQKVGDVRVEQPATYTFCDNYCPVAHLCPQHNQGD